MTRTILFALLVGIFPLATIGTPGVVNGQSAGGTSSGGVPRQPTGSKGSIYGPVLRTQTPKTTGSGQSPIRRAAGEEPVREPLPGGSATGGKPVAPKAGPVRLGPAAGSAVMPLEANVTPRQPSWYPLEDKIQAWVDEVLVAWEKTSEEIVTFKCNFKRWEYDPAFGPKDPSIAYTYGKGIIQYANPDKGMFKVESLVKYSAPQKVGDKPQYLTQIGEQWICDGRSIFEFDLRSNPKRVIQRILPKEMQGKAIADGPLPFLFGAKVSTIKARYWIRPAPNVPPGHEREYWLEAIPRFSRDAANFQKVSIILYEKDFLPKALDVNAPNFKARNNPAHTEYSFDQRETTLKGDKKLLNLDFLILFKREFYEPKVPSGWKKDVEDMNEMPQGPQPARGPTPGTATKSGIKKTK